MKIQIQNRLGKIKLNDGVHKESADKLIEELDKLYGADAVAAKMTIGDVVCSAADALEGVEIEINSPGGSVFEGHRIYNALRHMSARGVPITATVNGLAASMGSVILMAGDKRQMTNGSRIMIHEASTIAWGDARTMRHNADLLEGISSELAGIYAERTGGDPADIRNLMFAETWMDAEQAKAAGFIDAILKDGKEKAEFDSADKGNMSILAKLFPGNDQVAQLEASLAEAETLRADLEAAQARVGELSPLAEANAALQTELTDVSAKLAESERIANEAAEKIAELEANATKLDELAAIKASELLAAQGHPAPVSLVGDAGSPVDHIEKLASLNGAERTAYYAANAKEIRKQLTK